MVISAPGFTFRGGANTAWLTLPRQGDSPPRVFYLRAKPIQGPQQVRNVSATLWYHGAFLGKVTRQVTIITSRRLSTKRSGGLVGPSLLYERYQVIIRSSAYDASVTQTRGER